MAAKGSSLLLREVGLAQIVLSFMYVKYLFGKPPDLHQPDNLASPLDGPQVVGINNNMFPLIGMNRVAASINEEAVKSGTP